jgi:hypothetical protein
MLRGESQRRSARPPFRSHTNPPVTSLNRTIAKFTLSSVVAAHLDMRLRPVLTVEKKSDQKHRRRPRRLTMVSVPPLCCGGFGGVYARRGQFGPYLLRGPGRGCKKHRVSFRSNSSTPSPGGPRLTPTLVTSAGAPASRRTRKRSETEKEDAPVSAANSINIIEGYPRNFRRFLQVA